MDNKNLEKMRLSVVLFVSLVFGVFLQGYVFADDGMGNKNIPTNNLASPTAILRGVPIVENKTEEKQENNIKNTTQKKVVEKGSILTQTTEIPTSTPNLFPIRNLNIDNIDTNVKSVMVVSEKGDILYSKNPNEKLPIASLTKVVSAMVILDNIDLNEIVTITQNAIETEGIAGKFTVGEKINAGDLLKIMLVLSSNDAAVAFYDYLKSKGLDMVELMNKKVKDLGLKNTKFSNVVGLDDVNNYSTAKDYADIILYSLNNKVLWSVLSISDEVIGGDENNKERERRLISTNKLIFDKTNNILGGKTGFTEKAGGCLMTLFGVSKERGGGDIKVVSVILGAPDINSRFDEMKKIINWTKKAYIF